MAPRPVTLLVPILCLVFILSVVGTAVLGEGSPALWGAMGLGAAVGAGAGALAALALHRTPTPTLAAVAVIGVGLWRAATAMSETAAPWHEVPPDRVRAVAVVDAPVETRGSSALVFARIERIDRPEGLPTPKGRVRLTLPALAPLAPGEEIQIVGRFNPVDPAAPGGRHLLAQGVIATASFPDVLPTGRRAAHPIQTAIAQVRSGLKAAIGQALSEPHAALLAGLLLGSARDMPEEFRLALVASGTSHLVVASGYNITLVAAALHFLVRGRRLRMSVPFLGIWAFTALAGGSAPTVRAALMGTVALVAMSAGRGRDALGALALAVAIMLLVDPNLVFDLGFQLSVVATLGLIALQPRVAALMPWVHPWVREPISGTLAAQLAVLPILAGTFHQVSVVAPVSNVLAAPAVPVATIGGAIGVPIVAILPALSGAVGAILVVPTAYLAAVIEATATLPQAIMPVGDLPPGLAVLYAALLVVWAAGPTPEGRAIASALRSPRLVGPVAAGAAALLGAGLVAAAGTVAQTPTLAFSVLDVGGADAIFIRTPGQRAILIDGGASPAALLAQLGRRFGLLERQLSLVVLTRADADRLPAMVAAVERYPPAVAVGPPEGPPSALYQRWRGAVESRLLVADSPMTIQVEPAVTVQLLPTIPVSGTTRATESPQRSLIVEVVYGQVAFLVAPSLTREAVRSALEDGWPLAADVLVVPRHGGADALDRRSLATVAPSVALIPVGARNRAGHPARETLDLLEGIPTFRTDLHGSVEIKTDGQRLWVVPERTSP